MDWYRVTLAVGGAKQRVQGRQRTKRVVDSHNRAGSIHAIRGRGKERKLHGLADHEFEWLAGEVEGLPFFVSAWDHAHGLRRDALLLGGEPNVERLRCATADSPANPSTHEPVRGRAAGDRKVERVMVQERNAGLIGPPR